MNRTNGTVAEQEASIGESIENVRLLVLGLKGLTEAVKRYPFGILFGQPPAKQTSGQ